MTLLHMPARALALSLALSTAGCGGDPTPTPAHGPSGKGTPEGRQDASFHDLNGVMWLYTTVDDLKFRDLTAELDDFARRGIRVLGIYSPYDGDKDEWLGAAPRNFYDVPQQNGSLADFRDLVDAAHARNMKVVAFMGFHSIDDDSEFFRAAEAEYAAGDRTSREVATFHWTNDPTQPTPTPAPMGPSAWKQSVTAGAYYWSLWDNAGIDVTTPGGEAEAERAIAFWMEAGLDGFMLDSGVVDPGFKKLWIDLPLSYKSDLWLTFESTWSEEAESFDSFGLTSWFAFEDNDYANTYSRVVFPEEGETAIGVDELETELGRVDEARARGKLTHAWSVLERSYPDERMRVQEAALLAGAGVTYGAPMYQESYVQWPETTRADWDRVLVAVNANEALHPSASRARVPAGPDPTAYAMLRTSSDGHAALLAFNFAGEPATVAVDLRATGVASAQTPVDLYAGAEVEPIDGGTYAIPLPAYGFALLGVALATE